MGLPIYDNIDRMLKEKRMSRRQLAIKAGVNPSTISVAFVNRSTMFHPNNLQKIAAALDVTIEELTAEQPQVTPLGMVDGVPTAFVNPTPGTFYFSEDGTQRISAHAISEDECKAALVEMLEAFDTLNPAGMLVAAEQVKRIADDERYMLKPGQAVMNSSALRAAWEECNKQARIASREVRDELRKEFFEQQEINEKADVG